MPVPVVIGIIAAFIIIILVIMYSVRSWYRSWSATTDEVNDRMPGDEEIGKANTIVTTAITIRSPVSDVWPWLVQMGYKRGGMYSYDWIDRLLGILDRPSSKEIIPEFQHLEVGDVIPMGSGPGWPVGAIEPNHSLLLVIKEPGINVTWSFLLKETDRDTTRFILRIRTLIPMKLLLRILTPMVIFGSFLMTRKMLLGIKQRAETLSANKQVLTDSSR
jgi:hypothetical protein